MFSWFADPTSPGEIVKATFLDTIMLAAVLVLAGLVFRFLAWRRRRARESAIGTHLKRPGFFAPAPLAGDAEFLASLGAGGAAPETSGMRVMRSATGIRLLVTAITVLIGLWIFRREEGSGLLTLTDLILLAGCGWSALWIFCYELRWNQQEIIETRMFLKTRHAEWSDVIGVMDDGNHSYVLAFRDSPKMKVLKWLRGMPDFLARIRVELDQRSAGLRG